jgi:integrase
MLEVRSSGGKTF